MKRKREDIDVEKTGKNIERLIKESGWSVKDIAANLGVSPNAVRHWIKGRNLIDSANLIRLALLLGVHVEELYVLKEVILDEQVS